MKTKLSESQLEAIIKSHDYDVKAARAAALEHGEKSMEFYTALNRVNTSGQVVAKYYSQIVKSEAGKGYEELIRPIGRKRFLIKAINIAKKIGVQMLYFLVLALIGSIVFLLASIIKYVTGAELHASINTVILLMILGVVLNIFLRRK